VLPVIKAREDEIAATKLQKEASDALNNTLQDINKTQVDLGKAADKTNEAYKALQQTTVDHNAKLADIQTQYQQAQQSALMKKNDQLLKIDQQAAERALEQRENDNFSILQAVARGDIASAQATLAQQRIRDTQAQRQVQQQKDDAQKAYDDQLKAAQEQNAKLLDSENDRYAKERQQRQDAYDQALQDQQALINRLASLRAQEAFQAAYYANTVSGAAAQASNGVAVLSNALTSLANSFISTAQRMSSQVSGVSGGSSLGSLQGTRYPSGVHGQNPLGSTFVNDQLSLFYAAYNGTGGGGSRGFSASSYATGTDFVPQDMLAFIHRGERIIPASENNGMNGGVTVNVDARGSTIPQAQWEEWSERTAVRTIAAVIGVNNKVNRKGS
jgi:phage-related minor tail protein